MTSYWTKCDNLVRLLITPLLFIIDLRPPYGSASTETVRKLNDKGYEVIEWSTDTKDYENHDVSQEINNVRSSFTSANKNEGFIILAHDVYEQTTTEMTYALVEYIKQEGFKFCTVAECKLYYFNSK